MVSKAVPPTPGSKYRIRIGQTIGGLVWSNVAANIDGKWQIIYDDGDPDIWPISTSSSGSSRAAVGWTTQQIAKKNGWVIGGVIFVSAAAAQRGQAYVQAFVVDANYTPGSITDYLCMGYAYASKPLEFGTFVEPGPAGGPGSYSVVALAQPALGADYATLAGVTGALRKLRGFFGQLVTAATVANREFSIILSTSSTNRGGAVAGEIQTATLTVDYLGIDGGISSSGVTSNLAGGVTLIGLGTLFTLGGVMDVVFRTYNIQAGDQWSAGSLVVEEWVMPN